MSSKAQVVQYYEFPLVVFSDPASAPSFGQANGIWSFLSFMALSSCLWLLQWDLTDMISLSKGKKSPKLSPFRSF
jgi:hypothetical protein